VTADNECLLDDVDMCSDLGLELSELHDAAQARIAELEALSRLTDDVDANETRFALQLCRRSTSALEDI
jgi:hypothetical protein